MSKRFDFSSDFEDKDNHSNNNDASLYIDASQDLEHAIAALREAIDALNRATAEANGGSWLFHCSRNKGVDYLNFKLTSLGQWFVVNQMF